MNTTGATVWDFLISMRLPIWIVLIIIILVFCISNADKLLALSGAIAGLFRNISTKANKKYISAGIRSSVISASKKIGSNETGILPSDLKIKWADNDDVKSFFDDDCVVVRIRNSVDPNENYVNIIYQFVSSGLLKNQKHYFDSKIMGASTLLVTQKIVALSKPTANSFFIDNMIGHSAKVAENGRIRKQRELDALAAHDRELDMLFERLYEDNVAGKIDDARFSKMSKRYEQEQGENAKKIKALRLELKKDESKRMDIDDFLEKVRRYTDATTITKRMVAELIDHIEVYHAEKQDGITNQRVDIHYNCIGAFDVPDRRKIPEADIIMETRKGVALSYAPEQVAV